MFAFTPGQVWPFFVGTWIVLMAASFLTFYPTSISAALKKRLWPIFIFGVGVLFVLFSWLMGAARGSQIIFIIPAVALISALNIVSVRFCPSCNAMQRSNTFFSAPKFCQKCGHALDQ
jgi:hypothetical protein